ncbi:glycosyltransferase [Chloroflexus sp.]|uniref:glycosyltransferase n=1 Tax=Chloroflexus sp. TaxID=1904827 RepID=UPI002ACD8DE7|nr:glycosyltransferase [Chloroflexus sp.]
MHPHLVWHSTFASPTGYSSSSQAIVAALTDAGLPVRPLYLFDVDVVEHIYGVIPPHIRSLQQLPIRLDVPQVVYGRGDLFCKNSGAYRIGFTMLETDRLPASWVEQANFMDEVWTPTAWGREVFMASGVVKPVYVVPLGVDLTVFAPGPARRDLADRTVFLSVFEWSKRKGWDVLVAAYRAAFQPHDPVVLVLKIDYRAPGNPLRELAAALGDQAPPVAVLYNQTFSPVRMAELYRSADCLVLPSRGEGWGMPVLEAMACGVPVIATAWSGPTAFLDETCGYPLPIRSLTPTGAASIPYAGAQWAEPDVDALVELLRRVHRQRDEARALGAQAAIRAREWPWQRSAQTILDRLHAIG